MRNIIQLLIYLTYFRIFLGQKTAKNDYLIRWVYLNIETSQFTTSRIIIIFL
jgi:hypothetical protein